MMSWLAKAAAKYSQVGVRPRLGKNDAAALVDLRVITDTRSALVQLVDSDKRPLELGSTVQIEGKTQDFVVGYDGDTFLDDLGAANTLLVTTPGGGTCRAHFRYHSVRGQQVRIHALVCTPVPL